MYISNSNTRERTLATGTQGEQTGSSNIVLVLWQQVDQVSTQVCQMVGRCVKWLTYVCQMVPQSLFYVNWGAALCVPYPPCVALTP